MHIEVAKVVGVAWNKGGSLGYELRSVYGLNRPGINSVKVVINSREDPKKGIAPLRVVNVFFS